MSIPRIRIQDGTSWPSIAYTRALAWRLRHAQASLTSGELAAAAGVFEAYLALIADPSNAKKLAWIRQAEETKQGNTHDAIL